MRAVIQLETKHIGAGRPIFIIAEAGVNHNGDIDMAKRLVDVARKAGADCVKFQTFNTPDLVTRDAQKAAYQKELTGSGESQYQMLKRLELSREAHIELKRYCDKRGIIFASTPHSGPKDVALLESLGVPFYKIGSGDLTNLPFLKHVARTKKLIILSTGMGSMKEVKEAANAIASEGNDSLILLHCTTNYPAKLDEVNLWAMKSIHDECHTLVGYSDHTISWHVAVMAVALGAVVIEKHITLDKQLPGPDHKASLDPGDFSQYVKAIRHVEQKGITPEQAVAEANKALGQYVTPSFSRILGTGIKEPFPSESEVAKVARKSLVAARDIHPGTVLKEDDLAIKRPGTGLPPKEYWNLLGKRTIKYLTKDELLRRDHVA